MQYNSNIASYEKLAAFTLGAVPVGQTVYMLFLYIFNLPHASGQLGIFSAAILILPIITLILSKYRSVNLGKADYTVIFLFLLILASFAFRTIDQSRRDLMVFCLFSLGPFLGARLLRRDLMPAFFTGLIIFCGAAALHAIILIAKLLSGSEDFLRPEFLGINHGVHLVGSALAILICYLAARIEPEFSLLKRIFIVALIMVFHATIVVISSRGMGVAAFMAIFILTLALPSERRLVRIVVLVSMIVSTYIVIEYIPYISQFLAMIIPKDFSGLAGMGELDDRFCKDIFESPDSSKIRLALYTAAVDQFLSNPVFGVGFQNYGNYFCKGAFPHSTMLQIVAEFGLIGLISVGALLYFTASHVFREIRSKNDAAMPYFPALLTLLLFSLVIDQIYGYLISMTLSMTFLGATLAWLSDYQFLKKTRQRSGNKIG